MANRSMAAKRLKLKRQKRLFPRKLSADYVPVGTGPDRFVIREYKERTRSLAFDAEFLASLEAKQKFHGVPPGRLEALEHMKRIENTIPKKECVNIHKTPFLKADLFYNEDRTRFLIYEENYRTRVVRTSMNYNNRERCITAWQEDTIRWVLFSSVSPPT